MMKRLLYVFALLVLIVASTFTFAQDDEPDSSLHQIMALVPATPDLLTSSLPFSYVDYRAVELARPGVTPFASHEEFMSELDNSRARLWIASTRRISTGPQDHLQYMMLAEEMPQVVGFDFFDIDGGLYYGQPPGAGTLFMGEFDRENIRSAFTKRDYTQEEINGMEVWCPPNGCNSGMEVDLTNRNPGGNPFGGQLGRREPIILGDGWIFSAPGFGVLRIQAAVAAGDRESVLDLTEYSASANAILSMGDLIQVQYVNPLDLNVGDPGTLLLTDPEADLDDIVEQIQAELNEVSLPPYSLVAFADVIPFETDDELALIVLVYTDEADAEAAGSAVSERLETAVSLRAGLPVMELLNERQINLAEPVIYVDEEAGHYVTLLPFYYPREGAQPGSDGNYASSGLGFRLLMDMLYSRDLRWLAYDISLPD